MHIHVEIRTWKERERGGEEQVKREGEKGKERERRRATAEHPPIDRAFFH